MSTTTTIMAGYGPLDDDEVGIEEALVMADVADQEYRVAATEALGRFARIPGGLELDAHDLAGLHLGLGDLSAVD